MIPLLTKLNWQERKLKIIVIFMLYNTQSKKIDTVSDTWGLEVLKDNLQQVENPKKQAINREIRNGLLKKKWATQTKVVKRIWI